MVVILQIRAASGVVYHFLAQETTSSSGIVDRTWTNFVSSIKILLNLDSEKDCAILILDIFPIKEPDECTVGLQKY